MKGVLLTGATTPFGCALARALVADPRFGQILAAGIEEGAPGLPADPRLTYRRVDLTRAREIQNLLGGPARELGVEAVIHGAWHRSAVDGGRQIRKLNVESTRELLRLAEDHPTIEHFVLRSYADIYRIDTEEAMLLAEDHPLRLSADMPQILRDRLEADVTACVAMGMSRLAISVLRFAEVLAPDSGSQLFDYLSSRVCFRPLGFDPMLSLLSLGDAVRATIAALLARANGIFNIPGKDILPLSRAVALARRACVPVPGPLLAPLYALRSRAIHTDFRYDMNHFRFHLSGVVDGRRAAEVLGFIPEIAIDWQAISEAATLGRGAQT
jgi:UDP-glucose 4-epimerase